MTKINTLLLNATVQEAVWESFGFDRNMPLPTFPDQVLYGVLSEVYHNPGSRSIVISNMADDSYVQFFNALANYTRRTIQFYDEESAASYDDSI